MQGSEINLIITTKSNLVTRDIDLIKSYPNPLVAWSINTLDEDFKNDMDDAPSIKLRIEAIKSIPTKRAAKSRIISNTEAQREKPGGYGLQKSHPS